MAAAAAAAKAAVAVWQTAAEYVVGVLLLFLSLLTKRLRLLSDVLKAADEEGCPPKGI